MNQKENTRINVYSENLHLQNRIWELSELSLKKKRTGQISARIFKEKKRTSKYFLNHIPI